MTSADLIATIKKQPVGFACGVLCVILGALLYLRSSKIGESQAEYEAKSAEAAKILANVRYSDKLPEQVAEIQAATKEMESRLIRSGQLAVNLQYFYKLEAENEVKLLDVRQTPIKPSKALYIGIPYTVGVQGSYKQIVAFLQRLESGQHFCRFNNISFNKGGASAGAGGSNMTVNLTLELLGQP
jgi:Tfp pilus assembly protein PilO